MDNIFPNVFTRADVAAALNVELKYLTYVLYGIPEKEKYTNFTIPKKTGGERVICSPCNDLKFLQRKLAKLLYEYREELWNNQNNCNGKKRVLSHGFEKKRGIKTNAVSHIKKRFVINMDLEDFFDSFHIGRVCGFFEKNRHFLLGHEAAVTIAHLCCYNRTLPQGAPTSPVITNYICEALDIRLWKLAKEFRLNYTRYADDLSFSTNDSNILKRFDIFQKEVAEVIQCMGFKLNEKKTRILFNSSKQTVTGLIVNRKVHVDRNYYKETRAMAHSLYQKGEYKINGALGTIRQLEGRYSFIYQVERFNNYPFQFMNTCDYPETNDWNKGKNIEKDTPRPDHMNRRELDYQAFLFYKNFYANEKPLILCEGKTDLVYLKAALRALCDSKKDSVSDLVQCNFTSNPVRYIYNISFFRRSPTIQTMFKCSPTGASAYKYLIKELYLGDSDKKRWMTYRDFSKLTERLPKHPVIIIIDNEKLPDKPLKDYLKSFAKYIDKEKIESHLYSRIGDTTNLYLMTYKLPDEKDCCEIEDFLPQDVLSLSIDGRTFARHDEKGDDTHFGKKVLAKYVAENYKHINFEQFESIFQTINCIIKDYDIWLHTMAQNKQPEAN